LLLPVPPRKEWMEMTVVTNNSSAEDEKGIRGNL